MFTVSGEKVTGAGRNRTWKLPILNGDKWDLRSQKTSVLLNGKKWGNFMGEDFKSVMRSILYVPRPI